MARTACRRCRPPRSGEPHDVDDRPVFFGLVGQDIPARRRFSPRTIVVPSDRRCDGRGVVGSGRIRADLGRGRAHGRAWAHGGAVIDHDRRRRPTAARPGHARCQAAGAPPPSRPPLLPRRRRGPHPAPVLTSVPESTTRATGQLTAISLSCPAASLSRPQLTPVKDPRDRRAGRARIVNTTGKILARALGTCGVGEPGPQRTKIS
jgi:hypothetical protein